MTKFFKKYHKWIGLFFAFFILMFAFSGIFLNHRKAISGWDIPRKWLPKSYRYKNWNNRAVDGTLRLAPNKILMYGSSGVWLTDTLMQHITPHTDGLRKGVDNRNFRAAEMTPQGDVYAATTHRLYRLVKPYTRWEEITDNIKFGHDTFNDVYAKDSTLYVVMRNYIYRSSAASNYEKFERIALPEPPNYSDKVSLFRTMWVLHSGELFGLLGKLVVDFMGVIIIILTVTGLILTFWKIPIKRRQKQKKDNQKLKRAWNFSLRWHNRLGDIFFVLLMILAITGWFLRPPLLIAIVRSQVKPMPLSTLKSSNPWNNKIRNLRYDESTAQWMLYTSQGFYHFVNFDAQPKRMKSPPPVSVMGINVWTPKNDTTWIVGSFSGLFEWNPQTGSVINAVSREPYKRQRRMGPPVVSEPIAGVSNDFAFGPVYFDYARGIQPLSGSKIQLPTMSEELAKNGRISFWHFCLELHVGRLYSGFLGKLEPFFIFFAGLLLVFTLVSGYVVYRKKHRRRNKKRKRRKTTLNSK